MTIQIPADLTIVTLRTAGRELPQRFTEAHARNLLQRASDLLQARADIAFRLGTCERVVEEMPAGVRADVVDEAGYHYLAAAHRAGQGVRVLCVDRVSRAELGGRPVTKPAFASLPTARTSLRPPGCWRTNSAICSNFPTLTEPGREGPGRSVRSRPGCAT